MSDKELKLFEDEEESSGVNRVIEFLKDRIGIFKSDQSSESNVETCAICNRILTDPRSISIGIGPVCLARSRGTTYRKGKTKVILSDDQMEFNFDVSDEASEDQIWIIPNFSEVIFIQRNSRNEITTNVPHLITHHSPDGFEFGYSGSGPADLSINIIEEILRLESFEGSKVEISGGRIFSATQFLYHEFKFKFIATMTHDVGTVPYIEAKEWIFNTLDDSDPEAYIDMIGLKKHDE